MRWCIRAYCVTAVGYAIMATLTAAFRNDWHMMVALGSVTSIQLSVSYNVWGAAG